MNITPFSHISTFLQNTPRARIAASFLLRLWPMLVHKDLPASRTWTRLPPLLDGLLVNILVVVAPRQPPNSSMLQMANDKRRVWRGSRVIHGQNCPISDEISQKLDLYPDMPKRAGPTSMPGSGLTIIHTWEAPTRLPASNTSRSKCSRVCTPVIHTPTLPGADTPS